MSKKNRCYTEELKQEAIKLALNSASITRTAKDLGIPDATLHTWVRNVKNSGEQKITAPNGKINSINVTDVINENLNLKKRVARLEQEKAILKKAATYFAAELK